MESKEKKIILIKKTVIAVLVAASVCAILVGKLKKPENAEERITFYEVGALENNTAPGSDSGAADLISGSGTDTEADSKNENNYDGINGQTGEGVGGNTDNNASENGRISINKASKSKLMELPGIGETKANAIIEYREKYNGFVSTEEITQVKGIGESTYQKLKDLICL